MQERPCSPHAASSSIAWASSPQRSPERVGLFGGLDDGRRNDQQADEDEDDGTAESGGYYFPGRRPPKAADVSAAGGLFQGSVFTGSTEKHPRRRLTSNIRSSAGHAPLQPLSSAALAAAAAAGMSPLPSPSVALLHSSTWSQPPVSPSRSFHISSRGGEDFASLGLDPLPEETGPDLDPDQDLDNATRLELQALRDMWQSPGLYSEAEGPLWPSGGSNETSEVVNQLIVQAEEVSLKIKEFNS